MDFSLPGLPSHTVIGANVTPSGTTVPGRTTARSLIVTNGPWRASALPVGPVPIPRIGSRTHDNGTFTYLHTMPHLSRLYDRVLAYVYEVSEFGGVVCKGLAAMHQHRHRIQLSTGSASA
jgi:hypothetical protein